MKEKILVINPGSTSTKIAVFSDNKKLIAKNFTHELKDLNQFSQLSDQSLFRKNLIIQFLNENKIDLSSFTAIVGRGGLLKPISGGTYAISNDMINDLKTERYGTHASNLGGLIAKDIADKLSIPSFIVDPVVVDELKPIARISGIKGIERRSIGHALNQKMAARNILSERDLTYEDVNVVVAHLGGGISIAAHEKGRMVEMVNGLDGEGPYSPERTGTLPLINFAEKIIEKKLKISEVKKIVAGKGGIFSYLNDKDIQVIEKRMHSGDEEAAYYLDGMIYQVAQYIGLAATSIKGQVEYIILTGGISYSNYVTESIREYVNWIADVVIVPGEMEMEALYEGAKRVLEGVEKPKVY